MHQRAGECRRWLRPGQTAVIEAEMDTRNFVGPEVDDPLRDPDDGERA